MCGFFPIFAPMRASRRKSSHQLATPNEVGVHNLQSAGACSADMPGSIDDRHAALTEDRLDPVAAVNHVAYCDWDSGFRLGRRQHGRL